MTPPIPEPLAELLQLQRGILTRSQAQAAGISTTVIRARIRQGRWQCVYPGVYASFSGELAREAALWAAVLDAGPGAVLSYYSAAELDGLIDGQRDAIHVTIPRDRKVRQRLGVVIHRSDRVAEAMHPARLPPRTRIEETVLDLVAASTTLDDAVGWLTRALGRRLTSRDKLRAALALRTRIRWHGQLDELLSAQMAGVLSPLEYRYVRHVERPHGLPCGARQVVARSQAGTQYRDVLYQAYRLIVELDGQLAHPADARCRDSRRDNFAVAEHGLTTLRYSWLDITTQPCRTAAQIAAVLARRGYTGARPCRAGCPVGRPGSECAESTGSAALRKRRAG